MRFLVPLVVLGCALSGCNRASQSQEAIRQAVIDSVSSKVNIGAMDVDVVSVNFKGEEADATVAFRAKGSSASSGLQMQYTLQQKGGKWVVKDKSQAGGAPHGAVAPGAEGGSPHGGMGGGVGGDLPAGHPPLDGGAKQ